MTVSSSCASRRHPLRPLYSYLPLLRVDDELRLPPWFDVGFVFLDFSKMTKDTTLLQQKVKTSLCSFGSSFRKPSCRRLMYSSFCSLAIRLACLTFFGTAGLFSLLEESEESESPESYESSPPLRRRNPNRLPDLVTSFETRGTAYYCVPRIPEPPPPNRNDLSLPL